MQMILVASNKTPEELNHFESSRQCSLMLIPSFSSSCLGWWAIQGESYKRVEVDTQAIAFDKNAIVAMSVSNCLCNPGY
jgi:hypothetical protein